MGDILERILATKRVEVQAGKAARPLAVLEREAREAAPARGFAAALRRKEAEGLPAVIAEFKRASPSRGAIAAAIDPATVARSYESHGAACLSVLTDREYFAGCPDDLRAARAACALPVLRKDFLVDPWQVFEARAMGADCVLLIMGSVEEALLQELEAVATRLGMDVLAECHDDAELEVALRLRTPLIGINNRNLRTFEVDLSTSLDLASRVPPGRLVVSESGIAAPEDVARLRAGGIGAYLVGSSLVETSDPGRALAQIFAT